MRTGHLRHRPEAAWPLSRRAASAWTAVYGMLGRLAAARWVLAVLPRTAVFAVLFDGEGVPVAHWALPAAGFVLLVSTRAAPE